MNKIRNLNRANTKDVVLYFPHQKIMSIFYYVTYCPPKKGSVNTLLFFEVAGITGAKKITWQMPDTTTACDHIYKH